MDDYRGGWWIFRAAKLFSAIISLGILSCIIRPADWLGRGAGGGQVVGRASVLYLAPGPNEWDESYWSVAGFITNGAGLCLYECVIILVRGRSALRPCRLGGGRPQPPVVLSFSHFVARCCANGFLRSWPSPPSFSPSSLFPALPHLEPIITFLHFTALFLGGEPECPFCVVVLLVFYR